MSVKPYIFLGLLVCGTAGAVPHTSYAQSENLSASSSYIVLAQNESGERRSFFGRVFNRSDKSQSAKPLFLGKQQQGTLRSRSQIKPYDHSRRRRSHSSSGDVSWDAFAKAREAESLADTERAIYAGQQAMLAVDKEMKLVQAREAAAEGRARNTTPRKRMVYDPKKSWTYNPNKPREPEKRSRIFNSR